MASDVSPAGGRRSSRTWVLVVLAVLSVLLAVFAVVHRAGSSMAATATGVPSTSAAPAAAHPVATDACSWLAPADFAVVGVSSAALTAYAPSTGLQPGEVYCTGGAGVTVDLRWSVDGSAKSAHDNLALWVQQLREARWTVAPATVAGADDAYYLSTALDAGGRPTPVSQLLVQLGALRIVLAIPASTPQAQTASVSVATVLVARIGRLHVTKVPVPPPLPSGSASSG